MKADTKTENEVTAVLGKFADAYAKRDLKGILDCFASDADVVLYGTGADEKRIGVEQIQTQVESHFEHWDRLLFRDYLVEHPDVATEYGNLKMRLSGTHHNDRVAYTQAKSDFVTRVTATAKQYYKR